MACIVLFFGLFVSSVAWSNQIQDIEDLEKYTNTETIYRAKAQELTSEFAKYLAQAYPEHERAIFDKISPSDVEIYLVKYPDLRSSDTILALTAEINKLQSDIYDQQLLREEAKTNIRVRQRSPWYVHAMIPDGPAQ